MPVVGAKEVGVAQIHALRLNMNNISRPEFWELDYLVGSQGIYAALFARCTLVSAFKTCKRSTRGVYGSRMVENFSPAADVSIRMIRWRHFVVKALGWTRTTCLSSKILAPSEAWGLDCACLSTSFTSRA